MENLTLLEVALLILLLVIGGVAVKIGFSFDINAWLKARSEHQKERLKMLCPHVDIRRRDDGRPEVICLIKFLPLAINGFCSRCGFQTYDSDYPRQLQKDYAENPGNYVKRMKKFNKLMDRIYKL